MIAVTHVPLKNRIFDGVRRLAPAAIALAFLAVVSAELVGFHRLEKTLLGARDFVGNVGAGVSLVATAHRPAEFVCKLAGAQLLRQLATPEDAAALDDLALRARRGGPFLRLLAATATPDRTPDGRDYWRTWIYFDWALPTAPVTWLWDARRVGRVMWPGSFGRRVFGETPPAYRDRDGLLITASPTDVIVLLRDLRAGNMKRRRQAQPLRRDAALTDPAADLTVWFRTADFFRVAERWSSNAVFRELAERDAFEMAAANIYFRDDGVLVRYAARLAGVRPTLAVPGQALNMLPMRRPSADLFLHNLPPWAHRVYSPQNDGGLFAKPVSARTTGLSGERFFANIDCGPLMHAWRPDENSVFGALALLRPQLLLDVRRDGRTVIAEGMMPLPLGLPAVRSAGPANWPLLCLLFEIYLIIWLGFGLAVLAFVAGPALRRARR